MKDKTRKILTRIITVFAIILFLFGLILLVYPFIPAVEYEVIEKNQLVIPYETKIVEEIKKDNVEKKTVIEEKKPAPVINRIVIPAISVNMPIVEGETEQALNRGVWRIPGTGTPGSSNMVLTGHRIGYAYLPEDIRNKTSFYNLDKLKIGDYIIIYWKGKEYNYKVSGGEIVEPYRIDIEEPTTEHQLTLYTCDPIGTREKRLVRYAKPI